MYQINETDDWIVHKYWGIQSSMTMQQHYIFACAGLVMFILGFLGNGTVLFLFARFKSLRSLSNLFVLNLSMADFLLSLGNNPMFVVSSFYGSWIFGILGCRLYAFIGTTTSFVSINTLAAIAFDRCRVIVKNRPLRHQVSKRNIVTHIVIIWTYSFCWALTPFFGFGRYVLEGSNTSCSVDFLSRSVSNRVHVLALFVMNFVLPVLVICVSYAVILLTVARHRTYFASSGNTSTESRMPLSGRPRIWNRRGMESEIKIAKISIIVVFVFCVAWLPYASLAIVGVYGNKVRLTPLMSAVSLFCAKFSTVINPIVYSLLHPKFRKKLRLHIFSSCKRSSLSLSDNYENFHLHQTSNKKSSDCSSRRSVRTTV